MVLGKKIVAIALALSVLSVGLAASESSDTSHSASISAIAAGSPVSFTFMVLPAFIKVGSAHNELRLAAILAPAYSIPDAQIIARSVKGDVCFRYSRSLKSFMKSLALTKEDFKPLEAYLTRRLKKGKKDLLRAVSVLATYLETGQAPVFTISVFPRY